MTLISPQVTDLNRPFWEACRSRRLVVQRCDECGKLRYPIAAYCPACLAGSATWEQMSGHGVVQTFAVFRQAYQTEWSNRIPYSVALITLDEGPIFLSDLVDVEPEHVRVGLPVEVVFDAMTDEIVVPRFTPR